MADINGIVTLGASETPGGAVVLLLNEAGDTIVASTTSNASTGAYSFTGLPGNTTYRVVVLGNKAYRSRAYGPCTTANTDLYWANVVSMLHFDGANGSTSFTDEKGVAWTPQGSAAISTAQSKFGGASAGFPNATGDDGIYASANLVCPSGNPVQAETIEAFVYVTDVNGYQFGANPVCSQTVNGANGEQWFGLNAGKVTYGRSSGMLGGSTTVAGTTVAAINTWHHIAMTFDGTVLRVFLNGVLEGSATVSRGWTNTGEPFRVGRGIVDPYPANRLALRGYIDDFRVTRGVARYTANFTPPTAPFPNS